MTLPVNDSTFLGALYGAVKKYPGKVRALAADMDMPESTLYAKLRGEKGYPLDHEEAIEILNFLRGQDAPGWERPVQVFCHQMDHLAVRVPRALRISDAEGMRQVSEMMQEVADIAHALADGTSEDSAGGKRLCTAEWKTLDKEFEEAMEKIASSREAYRARYLADKKKGLVK